MPLGKRRKATQGEGSVKDSEQNPNSLKNTESTSNGQVEKQSSEGVVTNEKPSTSERRSTKSVGRSQTKQADTSLGSTTNSDEGKGTSDGPSCPNVNNSALTRTRTRTSKRPRREYSPESPVKKSVSAPKDAGTTHVRKVKPRAPATKCKRPWELWGSDDKTAFFEGLSEYGKDFESIQVLIAQRCKKRGVMPSLIKNKDQVRHFYYRTWNKISKFIQADCEVKKQALELYGLINYGEFRKKFRGGKTGGKVITLNEKYGWKLNELIQTGSTCLKIKGKNHRIKTTVCSALKKLNKIEEPKYDGPKVPTRITVECFPKTNKAWANVQSLSHNPRLRVNLKADRRLSSLINFLEKKWKPPRLKAKENLGETEERTELVLFPHQNCNIVPIVLKEAALEKPPKLSFSAYKSVTTVPSVENSKKNVCDSKKLKNEASEVESLGGVRTSPKVTLATLTDTVNSSGTVNALVNSPVISAIIDGENAVFPDQPLSCSELKDETVSEVSLQNDLEVETILQTSDKVVNSDENHSNDSRNNIDILQKEVVEKCRKGWSAKQAQELTFAELYMMFGKDGHLKFEYDWCREQTVEELFLTNFKNMLRRLVHVAVMEFTEISCKSKSSSSTNNTQNNVCKSCGSTLEKSPTSNKGSTSRGRVQSNNTSDKSPPSGKGTGSRGRGSKQTGSPATPRRNKHSKGESSSDGKVLDLVQGAAKTESVDSAFKTPSSVPIKCPPANKVQRQLAPNNLHDLAPRVHNLNSQNLAQGGQFLQQLSSLQGWNTKGRRRIVNRKPMIVQRTLLPKMPVPQVVNIVQPVRTNANCVNYSSEGITASSQTVINQTVMSSQLKPQTVISKHLNGEEPGMPSLTTLSAAAGIPYIDDSTTPLLGNPITSSGRIILPSSQTPSSVITSPHIQSMTLKSPPPPSLPDEIQSNSSKSTNADSQQSYNSTLDMKSLADLNFPISTSNTAQSSESPPNISTLLDMSFSNMSAGTDGPEKLLDLSAFSALLDNDDSKRKESDILTTPPLNVDVSDTRLTTPTNSPTRGLFGASDSHWLNGEVPELSFGGLIDSPLKQQKDPPPQASTGNAFHPLPSLFTDSNSSAAFSTKIDSTLQKMMEEDSMDYANNFAVLAAQIAGSEMPNS